MIETFPDAASAASAAASAIGNALIYALRLRGAAALAVTGGRSPGPVYDALSGAPLDWAKVRITLSDERFVDIASPDSNERLVRERLLQGRAARADFLSLRGGADTPEAAAAEASAVLAGWRAFDAVLLGMGEDGHVASLFPGSPALAPALDRASPPCVAVPQGLDGPPPQPRLSLSLPRLLSTRLMIVLASGSQKRRLLEQALDPAVALDLPLRALVKSAPTLRILWSA